MLPVVTAFDAATARCPDQRCACVCLDLSPRTSFVSCSRLWCGARYAASTPRLCRVLRLWSRVRNKVLALHASPYLKLKGARVRLAECEVSPRQSHRIAWGRGSSPPALCYRSLPGVEEVLLQCNLVTTWSGGSSPPVWTRPSLPGVEEVLPQCNSVTAWSRGSSPPVLPCVVSALPVSKYSVSCCSQCKKRERRLVPLCKSPLSTQFLAVLSVRNVSDAADCASFVVTWSGGSSPPA